MINCLSLSLAILLHCRHCTVYVYYISIISCILNVPAISLSLPPILSHLFHFPASPIPCMRCTVLKNLINPWYCFVSYTLYSLIFFSFSLLQKSIRQMKFARFYLRRKLEPCDSCCLCVGNLPTYLLDKAKYEAVLDEFLKDSKFKFCCTKKDLRL